MVDPKLLVLELLFVKQEQTEHSGMAKLILSRSWKLDGNFDNAM